MYYSPLALKEKTFTGQLNDSPSNFISFRRETLIPKQDRNQKLIHVFHVLKIMILWTEELSETLFGYAGDREA